MWYGHLEFPEWLEEKLIREFGPDLTFNHVVHLLLNDYIERNSPNLPDELEDVIRRHVEKTLPHLTPEGKESVIRSRVGILSEDGTDTSKLIKEDLDTKKKQELLSDLDLQIKNIRRNIIQRTMNIWHPPSVEFIEKQTQTETAHIRALKYLLEAKDE